MGNNISPTGGSPVNKIALVAKSAVNGKQEITDAKKEAKRLEADLVFIKEKAWEIRRPQAKTGKHQADPQTKQLAKLIEKVADLGLAREKPLGWIMNNYQRIGAQEAALQVIGGFEHDPESQTVAYQPARNIADDRSGFKESLGLRKRLTGAEAKLNSWHTAQRQQIMDKVGVEAITQVAQANDYKEIKALLAGGAFRLDEGHNTLKAIGQFAEIADEGVQSFDPGQTRENLKTLDLFFLGMMLKGSKGEAKVARTTEKMIKSALQNAPQHGNKSKENGEYFGAWSVIDHYCEHADDPKDKIIAGCAQAVLKEPERDDDDDFLSLSDAEYAELHQKQQARAKIRPYEPTGGVVALKTLAKELNCPVAQKILESQKSDREKLQLLTKLDK